MVISAKNQYMLNKVVKTHSGFLKIKFQLSSQAVTKSSRKVDPITRESYPEMSNLHSDWIIHAFCDIPMKANLRKNALLELDDFRL